MLRNIWKKYKKIELTNTFRMIGIALIAGLGAGYLALYKKIDVNFIWICLLTICVCIIIDFNFYLGKSRYWHNIRKKIFKSFHGVGKMNFKNILYKLKLFVVMVISIGFILLGLIMAYTNNAIIATISFVISCLVTLLWAIAELYVEKNTLSKELRLRKEEAYKFMLSSSLLVLFGFFNIFWFLNSVDTLKKYVPNIAIPTLFFLLISMVLGVLLFVYHNRTTALIEKKKIKR